MIIHSFHRFTGIFHVILVNNQQYQLNMNSLFKNMKQILENISKFKINKDFILNNKKKNWICQNKNMINK